MKRLLPLLVALLLLSSPLEAAISMSALIAEGDTANNASFTTTGTFTCANTAMCYCVVRNTDGTSVSDTAPTLTQTGQTWTTVNNVNYQTVASPGSRISIFRSVGAGATAATITADFGADAQTSISIACVQADGALLTGTNGSDSVVQTDSETSDAGASITSTLAGALAAGSAVLAFAGNDANAATIDAESGYTANTEVSITTPDGSVRAMWRTDGADTTPTFTASAGTPAWGVFTIEIAVAGGAATGRTTLLMGCCDR